MNPSDDSVSDTQHAFNLFSQDAIAGRIGMQTVPEKRGIQSARRIQEARPDIVKEDVPSVRQTFKQAYGTLRRLFPPDIASQTILCAPKAAIQRH